MGINIRYFIITIISIFLALGIGIFIGFMFDAQEILTSERDDLIQSLNEKFQALEMENKMHKSQITKLTKENESYNNFNEYIFPQLIKDRLTNITIGFIQLNKDYNYSDVMDTIIMAGGKVIPINSLEAINSNFVFNNIENEIVDSSNNLEQIDYYLIAGGCKKATNSNMNFLGDILTEDLVAQKNRIIAVEKNSVEFSYVAWFESSDITTINNVDSIPGKIALIFTLDNSFSDRQAKSIINRLMNDTINNLNDKE